MKEKGFCTPIIDEAEVAAKRRKEELDREIKMVQAEYEEKLMKKKKKGKEKKQAESDEKNGHDPKDEGKGDEEDKDAVKEKDAKVSPTISNLATINADGIGDQGHYGQTVSISD